jgi:uncharacterized protein (TIGR02145 family)
MIIVTTLVIPPGSDTGPFNLYSDSDGYTVPFATNVSAAALQAGYSSTVPNDATIIRVISTGLCTNFIDLNINLITTTTTTSNTSTSTSTSTSSSTTTTTTTCCVAQNVTIGIQTWSSCNLNVSTYSDGTPIPEVQDDAEWAALTTGAWCYLNNDPALGCVYGKLYNWYAMVGIWNEASKTNPALRKQLAPVGYRVPSMNGDVDTLSTFLGGYTVAGGKMKTTNASPTPISGDGYWYSPNVGATNSSGWSALPGGFRAYDTGSFGFEHFEGKWWTDLGVESGVTENFSLFYLQASLNKENYFGGFKSQGSYIRVLADDTGLIIGLRSNTSLDSGDACLEELLTYCYIDNNGIEGNWYRVYTNSARDPFDGNDKFWHLLDINAGIEVSVQIDTDGFITQPVTVCIPPP